MKYLVVIILIIFSACSNPDNVETNDLSSNILKDPETQSSAENSQLESISPLFGFRLQITREFNGCA